MDKAFKLSIILALSAIALILLKQSQNGRFQYVDNFLLDTRTGAFWSSDGSHFEPRAGKITFHHPEVDDQTSEDDRRQSFRECISHHPAKATDCVNQMIASRKAEKAAKEALNGSSEQENQAPAAENANRNQPLELKPSEVEIQLPDRASA